MLHRRITPAGFRRFSEGWDDMSPADISRIEHAGRGAFGWVPETDHRRPNYGALLAALVPAAGIIAVASTFIFAIL